jgi:hypothetical protein
MRLVQKLADIENPSSLANRLRSRRFRLFAEMAERMPRPLRILDLGGTQAFWERRGWAGRAGVFITTVNIEPEVRRHVNIHPAYGDVAALDRFADNSFDITFSNSVIEHLFTIDRQAAMAGEMQRLAPAMWLQTPNYWFPVEPHFLVPGWQWMPTAARRALVRRFRCGWRGPCPDEASAERTVREVRLMKRRELQRLFPGATIVGERFGGLVKSWIVHRGFDDAAGLRLAA